MIEVYDNRHPQAKPNGRSFLRGLPWEDFALLATAAILLFWSLGVRGLWAAEGRWGQITWEMLRTGDFFHPTIGGEPYFDKPLLTYWLRAAASFFAGTLNELVLRIPSALAGLAAVWATLNLGTRLWSARVGRIAGWLLLTTYAFLFWARTGTSEAENMAAILLAVAWYWARRDRPSFQSILVFYLIAFLGAMTKGLTAVVVPVLIVLPDMLRERRWRLLLSLRHAAALLLALLVYFTPFAIAALTRPAGYDESGLALVFQENILRYFSPFDHKGPIYLYLYQLPLQMLPWTPLFLIAVFVAARSRKSLDSRTRWLVQALVLAFLFFTISGSRRSYYILPLLPFCALLTAVFLAGMQSPIAWALRRKGTIIQGGLLLIVAALDMTCPLVLTLVGRVRHLPIPLDLCAASFGVGAAAVLVGAGLTGYFRRRSAAPSGESWVGRPWIGVAAVLLGGYFCCQECIIEENKPERVFLRELQARAAVFPPDRIALFPEADPTMLFQLRAEGPVRILKDTAQLRGFLKSQLPGLLVVQNKFSASIPPKLAAVLDGRQCLREPKDPWESASLEKKKWAAWYWDLPADGEGGLGMNGRGAAGAADGIPSSEQPTPEIPR